MSNVLVVDDDAANRYLLETVLQSHGYATKSACNGAEALLLAHGQAFDLVISDILMPVMDGFALCHAWRQDVRLTRIPFAFYTATYTESKDEAFGLSLGADRFLLKPLPPEVILQEVRSLLYHGPDRRRAPRALGESEFISEHNTVLFRKLEKKLADNERLEASNARLGKLLAASLNEIFVFDGESLGLTFVNRAALDQLGYQEAELEDFTPWDLCPGLGAGGFKDLLDLLREGDREKVMLETVFRRKDGSSYPVELHLEPMLDGGQLSFLAVVQDISERSRQEAEQRRLEAEIGHSRKLESLGRMASTVAHDMNNLLTPILALGSVLQLRYGDDAQLQKMVGTILKAAAQGRDLVAGLTEYARKGIPAPREVDLNAVVRNCVELLQPTAVPGISWQLDLAEALAPVLGDAAGLGRVLLNLCRNAVDAMPAGGVLTLGTRPGPARWVELWVADTGPGMAPEVLSRVLEPFFTTKDAGKGTGLGLAIVDAIVQAHAGTLELQSEEGQGTVVRIRLQVK